MVTTLQEERCSTRGCKLKRTRGDVVCRRHGGYVRCHVINCMSIALKGGQCRKHGKLNSTLQKKKSNCVQEGCEKAGLVTSAGFCREHAPKKLICDVRSCSQFNSATCALHVRVHPCKHLTCRKASVGPKGYCVSHGGGKICNKCHRFATYGAYCEQHYRKCSITDCQLPQKLHGLCSTHGGRPKCREANCQQFSCGKGLCKTHGGGYFCMEPTCNRRQKNGGFCGSHLREGVVNEKTVVSKTIHNEFEKHNQSSNGVYARPYLDPRNSHLNEMYSFVQEPVQIVDFSNDQRNINQDHNLEVHRMSSQLNMPFSIPTHNNPTVDSNHNLQEHHIVNSSEVPFPLPQHNSSVDAEHVYQGHVIPSSSSSNFEVSQNSSLEPRSVDNEAVFHLISVRQKSYVI